MNKKTYEFDGFLLDLAEKRLLRNDQEVSLQPKVFDVLVVFAERQGELVSRDELMDAVWADTFVEEANLRICVHALRKALGKNADGVDYIQTIPKRGYRFTAQTSEKLSQTISKDEISKEIIASKIIEKPSPARRRLLIGISIVSLICFLTFVFAWQKRNPQSPKNALGFNQLAVLPFESVNANESDLRTGLADAMITNLSKIKSLKVLPFAAVRRFTGQNFDALTVGKELQTDAVLAGSYVFEGENVRVTTNLLSVTDGATLWTETFTAQKSSNLQIENSIALRTARLLSLKIAEAEDEQSLANQNLNAEAVQNYLSARKIWRTSELFRRQEMTGLFEKTTAIEPNWARAQSGFAEALMTSDQLSDEWGKVEQTANRAIELDKSLAAPHAVLGVIFYIRDWNWKTAESEFKQAIALNPNYAWSYYKYSQLLRRQRRFAEAELHLNKAVEIEPFSPLFYSSFCELYLFDRKFEKALSACSCAKQIEPEFWFVPKLQYWIYIENKMYAELGQMVLGKLSPTEKAAHPLTKALAENNLRPFWQYLIDAPSKNTNADNRLVTKAMLYLQIGDKNKALDFLEMALEKHAENLLTVNADSMFDSIRTEKRFVEIIQKIGLK